MRRMRIIVLLCACILLCACPKQPIQRYITLVNKSGKEIVCQQLWCATITNADTLYECRIPTQGILANSSYLYESKYGWESDLGFLPYIQYLVLMQRSSMSIVLLLVTLFRSMFLFYIVTNSNWKIWNR